MTKPTWNGRTWDELETWEKELLPRELVDSLTNGKG